MPGRNSKRVPLLKTSTALRFPVHCDLPILTNSRHSGSQKKAKSENYLATLGVCNVAHSSLARNAEFVLLTRAGPEIGVASTKAFTTQLVAFMLIVILLTKRKPHQEKVIDSLIQQLRNLPARLQSALLLEP